MSTSLINHGFKIPKVEYVTTSYEDSAVHFHVESKPEAVRCPTCHSPEVRLHSGKERRFRYLPIGKTGVTGVSHPTCGVWELRCGTPDRHPLRRSSQALQQPLGALRGGSLPAYDDAGAEHLGMSWDTVKEIKKQYLLRHYARP